jgi:alkylated DNA repair dioxygenase AlkB
MADLFSVARAPSSCIEVAEGGEVVFQDAPEIRGIRIILDGGELLFSDNFFSRKLSDRMVEYMQENDKVDWRSADWASMSPDEFASLHFSHINWKQDYIKFYGKTHPLPRLTAWHGDPGASYSYSGIRSDPNPWNEGLLFVKSKIEEALHVYFNSVLLNWYRDGSDSLSWHADDEKELGPEPTIASATFGEGRAFLFRRRRDKKPLLSITLDHGSLLVMRGETQRHWVHSVPKRGGIGKSRFNLTFRQIHTP